MCSREVPTSFKKFFLGLSSAFNNEESYARLSAGMGELDSLLW
jgi:hypothetical protein